MNKRIEDGIISAFACAVAAILFEYLIYGEIRWGLVLGLTLGSITFSITRKFRDKEKL
ncbi:hypothetical protein [Halobacillus litoralis]|uniref:hypothetical protein n=1 Tax=Halobacillus litoralis TaxID=45668 RepID=UPI00136CBDF9|nr:hypothetical protein [Halobacillus litoralis]MYL39057.1 hypothetical protein [Halobacillus litoralis]